MMNTRRTVARLLVAAPILAVLGAGAWLTKSIGAQGAPQGRWRTLPYVMPINPVHAALLNTGTVLIVSGSGNVAANTDFEAAAWDPQAGTVVKQPLNWDMFCNGMVVLPDGRAFVNGGTLAYDPFHGELRSAVYDPSTGAFADVESMNHGRWYPTVTTLGDGRVLTFSGLTETGATNATVEIYTAGTGWSQEYAAGWTPPLYPRLHLLPNGTVFYSGSGRGSRTFSPATNTWSAVVANTNYSGTRTYGTSVLLPLTVASGYKPRVMIMGGGNPSTATTEIIDLSQPTPRWTYGPSMSQPRIEMNATILPNGKVLATGGSLNDEDTATASLNADLYDPGTNTFSPAGANAFPRLYHSNSLLLPDATVALFGGNPQRGNYESRVEIYSPAYLFNADGSVAPRPAVTDVTSAPLAYGSGFQVTTPDASTITSVVLIRPGAPTHAFDMDQRLVELSYSIGVNVLNVTAPPNGNIAPPGYYMLFVLNSAGVPSVARFVNLTPSPPNQRPTATILNPAANVTVNAGGSVSFAGSGSDSDGTIAAYSWTFPGGNPGSSSAATPGNVTYPAPGVYAASLTVTDNGGLTSPSATRTITVPDFAVSATPSSQTAIPGDSRSYTATVSAGSGFSGTVAFSVSGLPSGASASFNPASVSTSGSTTMTVATSASTPAGTYTLTITGSSGTLARTATVTLVLGGDFSVTVSPGTRTISRNGTTTYIVTVTAGPGFSGTVTLTASGLPRNADIKFNPPTIANAGNSTATVNAKKNVVRGTYALTLTGTSGGLVHSATVTLIVQ